MQQTKLPAKTAATQLPILFNAVAFSLIFLDFAHCSISRVTRTSRDKYDVTELVSDAIGFGYVEK